MTTHDSKPYTYLIGWRTQDLWYYGSRHANTMSPEDDLWKEYFTSSKYVEEARLKFGEPDVRKVHRVFESAEAAHQFEYKFLKRVNAKSNPKWINQTIMGAPMGGTPNQIAWAKKPKNPETREKMRLAALKRWENDDKNRERASIVFKTNNPNSGGAARLGKSYTTEQRKRISDSVKSYHDKRGRKVYPPKVPVPRSEINAKISESLKAHVRSSEHKANIGKAYNNSEQARENRRLAQQDRRRRELDKKCGVP